MVRIYVPLDKNMTDEEIVRALKDAAEVVQSEDMTEEAEQAVEALPDEVSDE